MSSCCIVNDITILDSRAVSCEEIPAVLFNYKTKRTVSELFFRLKYSCMNSELLYFYSISVFLRTVLYFIKKWFIVMNFTLPSYFETLLFRTFFPFPWDFEIAGFNCILIFKVLKGGCKRCWVKTSCKDFKKDNFLALHSLQARTCTSLPLLKK